MKRRYLLATFLYCAAVFWVSLQPRPLGVDIPGGGGLDKAAHLAVYAGLAGLVSLGLQRSETRLSVRWQFWLPVLFAAAYGAAIEICQIYVPQRTFSVGDILANTSGAFAAQYMYGWWRSRQTAPVPAK